MKTPLMAEDVIAVGRDVVSMEGAAVAALEERIGQSFVAACELMRACHGRIVVTGIGKSGIIARKVAATLASTGSPALFLHPAEGAHGDLGMLTRQDCLLAISSSGETGELLAILPMVKRLSVPLIALTGRDRSSLAEVADVHLDVSVEREACPLNLAPTTSTTVALAMGDALAMALLRMRGFTEEDFALSHPGGALGRRLLLRVEDIMHSGDRIPFVQSFAPLREAIVEMSEKGLGMTAVVDGQERLVGVFTDGDLRRFFDHGAQNLDVTIGELANSSPRTVKPEFFASEALAVLEKHAINGLLVVDDDGVLVGAFNMHDLLRAGVV